MGRSYKDAGVDIAAAEESVGNIKSMIRSTFSQQVLSDIGLFGGFFQLDTQKYKEPVLVSSVDGVGTKLKIAQLASKHDTVGCDLVNHCVNDIAVSGATPLYFMDYFAAGKLNTDIFTEVIRGFTRGCRENGCALIGGETAEMPGFYTGEEYDIAGMIVGIVEKSAIIKGDSIKPGNILIGLPSNGLHTNGFSLARSVLLEKYSIDSYIPELGVPLGEELLRIHISYLQVIQKLIVNGNPAGFSHITGGGIEGNTRRILPEGCSLKIDWGSWDIPPIFRLIQDLGRIEDEEMRKVFNLGIGLVVIAPKPDADGILGALRESGESPIVMGDVTGRVSG